MTLYYSDNPNGQFDIYYATRNGVGINSWTPRGLVLSDPNNPSNNLVNTLEDEMGPSISDDGTLLYFDRMNIATETTEIRCAWGGVAAGPNNVPPPYFPIVQLENRLTLPYMISASPDISADYNFIVFERKMIGETDDGVWIAARKITMFPVFPPLWCLPQKIINSDDQSHQDRAPCIAGVSGLHLRIYMRSTRPLFPPPSSDSNIWVMTRN